MELNYFIDSWNRIPVHQIVHLLNNRTVWQIICKYSQNLNAVNKTKVTSSFFCPDNKSVLKVPKHEQ